MISFPEAFLTDSSQQSCMEYIPTWELKQMQDGTSSLFRSLKFDQFEDCIRFMTLLIEDVNKLDHHPNWANNHDRLDIELTTWDKGKTVGIKD